MKKLTAFLLALVASIGTTLASVQIDSLFYELDTVSLTAKVVGYDKIVDRNVPSYIGEAPPPEHDDSWEWNLAVPASVEYDSATYRVTSVGKSAFFNCMSLHSVTVPGTVTCLEERAFAGCWSLYSVYIPNSVTSIGEDAFMNSSVLAEINVAADNSNYSSLDGVLFSKDQTTLIFCPGGKRGEYILPDYVTNVEKYAFFICDELTHPVYNAHVFAYLPQSYYGEYEIPEGIESIADGAFASCQDLTKVTIPNSVTSIGDCAFATCLNLESVNIPNRVTSIGERAFEDCHRLPDVIIIPSSVTSIGERAFYDCGLKSVILNSNAVVGKNYTEKSNLSDIFGSQVTEYILGDDITSIGDWAFFGCNRLTRVIVGNNIKSVGNHAFDDCPGLTEPLRGAYGFVHMPTSYSGEYEIPIGIRTIAGGAFFGCKELTKVTVPAGVTFIGDNAFSNCPGLTEINVAAANNNYCSVDGVLYNKNQTKLIAYPGSRQGEYTLPDNVTSVVDYAFDDCSGLTNPVYNTHLFVRLPKSYSGKYKIPKKIKSIACGAFAGCTKLTNVIIPISVTDIGDDAFSDCWNLSGVTIPKGVTSIGNRAFSNCLILSSVTIPNSVTSIGDYAFAFCTDLVSVTISNSVTSIGKGVFLECTYLWDVNIPNSVTCIGEYAFAECRELSITIPASVTSIALNAFSYCYNMSGITCKATIPPVCYGENDLQYIFEVTPLYVPEESLELYRTADGWKEFKSILPLESHNTSSCLKE